MALLFAPKTSFVTCHTRQHAPRHMNCHILRWNRWPCIINFTTDPASAIRDLDLSSPPRHLGGIDQCGCSDGVSSGCIRKSGCCARQKSLMSGCAWFLRLEKSLISGCAWFSPIPKIKSHFIPIRKSGTTLVVSFLYLGPSTRPYTVWYKTLIIFYGTAYWRSSCHCCMDPLPVM